MPLNCVVNMSSGSDSESASHDSGNKDDTDHDDEDLEDDGASNENPSDDDDDEDDNEDDDEDEAVGVEFAGTGDNGDEDEDEEEDKEDRHGVWTNDSLASPSAKALTAEAGQGKRKRGRKRSSSTEPKPKKTRKKKNELADEDYDALTELIVQRGRSQLHDEDKQLIKRIFKDVIYKDQISDKAQSLFLLYENDMFIEEILKVNPNAANRFKMTLVVSTFFDDRKTWMRRLEKTPDRFSKATQKVRLNDPYYLTRKIIYVNPYP